MMFLLYLLFFILTYLLNIDITIFLQYHVVIILKSKRWYRSITNDGGECRPTCLCL